MSCDLAAAAVLWLAAASGPAAAPAGAGASAVAVAQEPLFVDIVQRAGRLKGEVEGLRRAPGPLADSLKREITDLSKLDMQAHLLLKARGTDGDLKCILKGISEDLPLKLQALDQAAAPKDREMAITDLAYLLNDNVEVITAPPRPPV